MELSSHLFLSFVYKSPSIKEKFWDLKSTTCISLLLLEEVDWNYMGATYITFFSEKKEKEKVGFRCVFIDSHQYVRWWQWVIHMYYRDINDTIIVGTTYSLKCNCPNNSTLTKYNVKWYENCNHEAATTYDILWRLNLLKPVLLASCHVVHWTYFVILTNWWCLIG